MPLVPEVLPLTKVDTFETLPLDGGLVTALTPEIPIVLATPGGEVE